ncbi:MAG: MBOAT family O-acyltransferase [Bacilli bacterium]
MCWKPEYVIIIFISTCIDYFVGILISKNKNVLYRKIFLFLSLLSNLGILFFFKYANFLSSSIDTALRHVNIFVDMPYFNVLLPVGISFYTFQTMSYTIDVYRGKKKAEKHFGFFAAYVSFFPQLVAGPIERSSSLLPQFSKQHNLSFVRIKTGMELVLWGLVKKMVIADMISPIVNNVYSEPQLYNGVILIFATFLFSIQIYCDFSGYSDIAIGLARIMGFDLMVNFKQPYFSKSFSEFWNRWHISLSSWFRDYLYIPLGGNRVSKRRFSFNIVIVFLLSGLWHGANWTFLIWGFIHGLYLLIERYFYEINKKLGLVKYDFQYAKIFNFIKICMIYALVVAAWVPFRSNSIEDFIYIYKNILIFKGFNISNLWALGLPRFELSLLLIYLLVLFVVDYIILHDDCYLRRIWDVDILRRGLYCIQFYSIVFFGVFDKVDFIYFQF